VGEGVASPALVGGKLYVFCRQNSREVTRCLEAASGREVWKDEYAARDATGAASRFPVAGPRSSPAVAEGKVITLGVRGTLSCLDAVTGQQVWRKDDFGGSVPRFFTSSSPLIVDGMCIAQLGGDRDGGIVAYALSTGEQKWKWMGDGPAYASLAMVSVGGTPLVVAQTFGKMVALKVADGTLVWETPFAPVGRGYNASSPLVEGQTIFYAGSGRGITAVRFEAQGDKIVGDPVWHNDESSVSFNSPVIKGGLLYGLSARNELFCVNVKTGKTEWTQASAAEEENQGGGGRGRRRGGGGGGGYGTIVSAGSVLLGLTPNAELTVIKPDAKAFTKLASYKVSEKETYSYPIATGKRIYVKDRDSLALWMVE